MRNNLLDQCPVTPFETVKHTIESSLGKSVDELFSHIETTPVASASLAQVMQIRRKEIKQKFISSKNVLVCSGAVCVSCTVSPLKSEYCRIDFPTSGSCCMGAWWEKAGCEGSTSRVAGQFIHRYHDSWVVGEDSQVVFPGKVNLDIWFWASAPLLIWSSVHCLRLVLSVSMKHILEHSWLFWSNFKWVLLQRNISCRCFALVELWLYMACGWNKAQPTQGIGLFKWGKKCRALSEKPPIQTV